MKLNHLVSEDYLFPGTVSYYDLKVLLLSQQMGNVLKNQAPLPRKGSWNPGTENIGSLETNEESKTMKKHATLRGEISNINHIFEHVIEEGKKVNESLKTVNTNDGKGFLSFF